MNQERAAIDEQLQQLAITAQQHPVLTQERQLALRRLVNGILYSGRLCYPQRGQFASAYEDIYDEAVQELMCYVCQNIHKYEPERGSVMTWVNVLLERRFFREAIPKVIGQQHVKRIAVSELNNIAFSTESPTSTELIRECIEIDSDDLFKQEYIEHKPTANFQTLALQRIAGKSWKEIAAELDINASTVRSFYSRCVTKFAEKLRAYCIDGGC